MKVQPAASVQRSPQSNSFPHRNTSCEWLLQELHDGSFTYCALLSIQLGSALVQFLGRRDEKGRDVTLTPLCQAPPTKHLNPASYRS
mmetsp:Transcript_40565/g.82947  ORF Transcript_40565/g.82947 Transcript_40565/m.82947 type:complete len:87 (-) Transcript_40565:281-541(-)